MKALHNGRVLLVSCQYVQIPMVIAMKALALPSHPRIQRPGTDVLEAVSDE